MRANDYITPAQRRYLTDLAANDVEGALTLAATIHQGGYAMDSLRDLRFLSRAEASEMIDTLKAR